MDPRPAGMVPTAPPMPEPERLSYRVDEVAAMTGLGRKTVYDKCYRGELDCRKDTGQGSARRRPVLVMAASVRAWLDSLPTVSG